MFLTKRNMDIQPSLQTYYSPKKTHDDTWEPSIGIIFWWITLKLSLLLYRWLPVKDSYFDRFDDHLIKVTFWGFHFGLNSCRWASELISTSHPHLTLQNMWKRHQPSHSRCRSPYFCCNWPYSFIIPNRVATVFGKLYDDSFKSAALAHPLLADSFMGVTLSHCWFQKCSFSFKKLSIIWKYV